MYLHGYLHLKTSIILHVSNYQHERKPILVIDIPDELVMNDNDKITELRETINRNYAIDLTDGKLNTYYENGSVSSEKSI